MLTTFSGSALADDSTESTNTATMERAEHGSLSLIHELHLP